jgi:ubiquinone/menaquinone biosynthesis C-methylase UbiE
MVRRAHELDPSGDYRLVADADLSQFADESFDLVLSAFTFDNIPMQVKKAALFREIARVLKPSGRILNLVSTPEIYLNEWASFSTKDFPENARAKPGDEVRIIVTAIGDPRPAVDILWPDKEYRETYGASGLKVIEQHNPLGLPDEPYTWVNETKIAPWSIYVLGKV